MSDITDDFDARAQAAALKETFEKRVARVATRLGLPVKSWSLGYVSGLVRRDNDGAAIADEIIAKRLESLVPAQKIHFDLRFNATRAGNGPTAKLEHARKVAAALTPKQPPQKMRLTVKERAWIERHGPEAMLELANRAANGEAPLFDGDADADE